MRNFLNEQVLSFGNKFKIPTLLGLGIIVLGIGVGVFLVLREQTFLSSAAPSQTPQNIAVSNIEDASAVVSWQTTSPALGFVTFGQQDEGEQTALDDRDTQKPQVHLIHYVTIKNLLPKTLYKYKTISGKLTSKVLTFTTASPITASEFRPVIGSALDQEKPLDEGIAYLSISDALIQTALIKNLGNFLIPLSQVRKSDLSDIYPLSQATQAKLTVTSANGQAVAVFNLKNEGVNLPPLKIGQTLDLTTPELTPNPTPSPTPNKLQFYDLNGDGKINAADYSIALKNRGKKINNILIDQQYLDLMNKQINQ